MTQVKIFISGAVLGAILGAVFLGSVVNFLVIGVVVAAVGAALYRVRRGLLGRLRDDKRLKA